MYGKSKLSEMSDSSKETVIQCTVSDQVSDSTKSVDQVESSVEITGTRERKMTAKGLQWKVDTLYQNFTSSIFTWRRHANKIVTLLSDSSDVRAIKSERNTLVKYDNDVSDTFKILEGLLVTEDSNSDDIQFETEELYRKYEGQQDEHLQLVKRIADRITDLNSEIRSSVSHTGSRVSRSSRCSNASKRSNVAAEAAALRAKLKYIDIVAKSKADLERVETLRELDIAQAKFDALGESEGIDDHSRHFDTSELLPRDGMNEYVNEYVKAHAVDTPAPIQTSNVPVSELSVSARVPETTPNPLNPVASEFYPQRNFTSFVPSVMTQAPTQSTSVRFDDMSRSVPVCSVNEGEKASHIHRAVHTSRDTESVKNNSEQDSLELFAKTLAEQINLSRLPPPEPTVFYGDPLKYPGWKATFQTLIEQRKIPPVERIHYLRRYIGGPVKDVVENFFLLSTDSAYDEAKVLLDQRYGDPFVIANAFRDRLENWPKINARDGNALQKYGDFLKQCLTAMKSIGNLSVLNDDRENKKMIAKLPDWVVTRWGRIVAQRKEEKGEFPAFESFVCFIVKEAKIACDPVTSLQSVKEICNASERSRTDKPERRYLPNKTRSVLAKVGEEGSPVTTNMSKNDNPGCLFCAGIHHLNKCRQFLSKSVEDRKQFVRDKKLCFGCLCTGHVSKRCRKRMRCAICSNFHPSSLHGDIRRKGVDGLNSEQVKGKSENGTNDNSQASKVTPENSIQEPKMEHALTGAAFMNTVGEISKSSMVVPVYVSHVDKPECERLVYALLDTQSDTSFILEDTCRALGLKGQNVKLLLSTMYAENRVVDSQKVKGLVVRGFNSDARLPLPDLFTRNIMPANRSHIPTPEMTRNWPHLKSIAHELMPLNECEVGLLIGYNCTRALAPREVIPPEDNGPYAQRTDLGWGIVGIVDHGCLDGHDIVSHRIVTLTVPSEVCQSRESIAFSLRNSVKEVVNPHQISRLMELDFSERYVNPKPYSREDQRFLTLMKEGIHFRDGHYEMPLPFKSIPHLPGNKQLALHRLTQLQKRLVSNDKYKNHYFTFMRNLISKGHAEKVPDNEVESEDGHEWYIPHHGVYHPQKPDKIRVVFDCSSKYKGECLNDYLLQGPDLTNALVGVLCRFRKEPYAFTCDIEQMFHQFKVNVDHRNYLKFLWWENENFDNEPKEYRMTVHLFGATSSPGCANFGLKQVATDYENQFGIETAEFLRNDFYVDDGLRSLPSAETAIDMIKRSKEMCSKGGLRLHKFVSNSKEVLTAIPHEDRAKALKDSNLLDKLPIERALGVQWCIESDSFRFRVVLCDRPLTRRGILSTVCSVYDPLGLLSPVILLGKQILQQMCKTGTDWDGQIPDVLRVRWERWREQLNLLENLSIRRCLKPDIFEELATVELHHFSDASTDGYGQCSYLRLIDNKQRIHCSLVMGKARVTPLKPVTIPRLELTAALVSVKVSSLLRGELKYDNVVEYFWTDSNIVLGYISNDSRRFHVFVANRVQQIRESTSPSQWRHVSSQNNPADIASRGATANELCNSSWFRGPDFIWNNCADSFGNYLNLEMELPTNDPEVKKVQNFGTSVSTVTTNFSSMLDRLEYFSNWTSAKKAIALCLKLKSMLRNSVSKNGLKGRCSVEVEDMRLAEIEIFKLVQADAFPNEMQTLGALMDTKDRSFARNRRKLLKGTSSLFRLDPFLDSNGLLRVGGRLCRSTIKDNEKHPIILPRKSHITSLIIRHCHERIEHQGRGMTINEIRENGFWIIGCSSAVSRYIHKCVKCRRMRGGLETQKMADLPEDRLQSVPPFTYSGVDFFGPWFVREGRKEVKRYGVLFTCMSCRAIHLETAISLDTSSFINALRRFIAIRGPVRQLRSDRGTNFVGADRELREALLELDEEKLSYYLSKEGCDYVKFEMNVPSASHMGGVWERQIRSVRNVLSSLMYNVGSQLDDESLRTFMYEAAAIVNGRPLTINNLNDPLSLEPLTPNHLLTAKSKVILPPPGEFQKEDIYSRKRWRRVQYALNEFWTRWRKEFLQNLQTRSKWIEPKRNLCVDDIVLVKDNNLPRNKWLLGRINDAEPDADGLVRKVKVVMGSSNLDKQGRRVTDLNTLERPIHKLVFLCRFPDEELE